MKEPTLTGRCNAKGLAMHLVVNKLLCPRLAYFPCFSTYEVTICSPTPGNVLGMRHVWKHLSQISWHSQLKWSNPVTQLREPNSFSQLRGVLSPYQCMQHVFCFTVNGVHLSKSEARSLGEMVASVQTPAWSSRRCYSHRPPKAGISFIPMVPQML